MISLLSSLIVSGAVYTRYTIHDTDTHASPHFVKEVDSRCILLPPSLSPNRLIRVCDETGGSDI